MRNSNTHSLTMKKKLKKSKTTFNAYNELQYRYGIKLDDNPDILEIQANIKLVDCPQGDSYSTDFYCVKTNGELMVRECVYKDKLFKPMTTRLLDISRNYWLSKGISDWGIVISEKE